MPSATALLHLTVIMTTFLCVLCTAVHTKPSTRSSRLLGDDYYISTETITKSNAWELFSTAMNKIATTHRIYDTLLIETAT
mmetsp:Transcript_363/g.530  ORF Transcript_363/g.530 Transcript_363/m.530 type:complete len:81 (+) Transcript_363:25-267(+)